MLSSVNKAKGAKGKPAASKPKVKDSTKQEKRPVAAGTQPCSSRKRNGKSFSLIPQRFQTF